MKRRRTTVASRRPLPMELRVDTQRTMRLALAFSRLMLAQRGAGLMPNEIAKRLEVSVRHAHRLILAACLAGWPLVRDDEYRWKLAR